MANEQILHVKDSYYFEVPKWLWRADYSSHSEFPDVWVRLDPDFQQWEAKEFHRGMKFDQKIQNMPSEEEFLDSFSAWQHAPENHGRPVKRYVSFLQDEKTPDGKDAHPWVDSTASSLVLSRINTTEYSPLTNGEWSADKIAGYNNALSGKILIPQPLGTLRNLYQKESGFAISRFMVIEMFVAVIMLAVFILYARKVKGGQPTRGRFWNLIDVFVLFIRDQVVRPSIGHGSDKFLPFLLTIFFFVLGCNLFGMLPWMGSPTGSIAVTITLAIATLGIGLIYGALKFGPIGVWLNLIPGMDVPPTVAIIVKPMLFVIEIMGLFIKHTVLGVRLLFNMLVGHIVLLAIMELGVHAQGGIWFVAAPIALVGSILISMLELFVAFLQAYIFVLLASLFVGASTHHH
ncbi:MAG: F0F1 ATP synthase subunit A [Pirellulaceae bacterium]